MRDILEDLSREGRKPAYTTVLTLLGRLEARGHVQSRRDGGANLYTPRTERKAVLSERLGKLVKHLGGGKAAPLILQLVEEHSLSRDDIRSLREFLDRLAALRALEAKHRADMERLEREYRKAVDRILIEAGDPNVPN